MYNRYIPEDTNYTPIGGKQPFKHSGVSDISGRESRRVPCRFTDLLLGEGGLSALLGKKDGIGLSGLLKAVGLEGIDSGDVLLFLIMLYLMAEGDDLDLVIALGITLFMGLGGEE